MGSSCFARGNTSTVSAVQDYVRSRGLEGSVEIGGTLCQQRCGEGPNIQVDGECVCGVDTAARPALLDGRLGLR
jgi:NADH:ubiquinone oxidoreductase subunit E